MPYRHDSEVELRRAALAEELARVRDAPMSGERRDTEAALARRIAALALPAPRRTLPPRSLLPRLRIASPCTESWDAMVGGDRARHCSRCARDVFDLSAMTREEVVALLVEHDAMPDGGLPCIRFYRRADGTILTADCLAEARRRRTLSLAAAGAAAALGVSLTVGLVRPPPTGVPGDADLAEAPLEEPQVAFGLPERAAEDHYRARALLGRSGVADAEAARIETPESRADSERLRGR